MFFSLIKYKNKSILEQNYFTFWINKEKIVEKVDDLVSFIVVDKNRNTKYTADDYKVPKRKTSEEL